jgi:aldose 1-epimerase
MSDAVPRQLVGATAGAATIAVDPADGGRLVSLRVGGVELLGAVDPAPGAPPQIFSGCFAMVPWVGRTAHGRFDFEGAAVEVPLNMGRHAIHGLGFDRPWQVRADGPLVLTLDLGADPRWPFGGHVVQRFALAPDRLSVSLEVTNDQRPMPAIVGFHPWFTARLATGEGASYDFHPGVRYLCDDSGIPVGTTTELGARPWDDSFARLTAAPVIRWGGRIALAIESDASHWILCETMPGAFCIEPLSGPVNGLATGEAAVAGPDTPLRHAMTLRWTQAAPHLGTRKEP